MLMINKLRRFFLKKKMRSNSLKDYHNIIYQSILFLIYKKNKKLLLRNINVKNIFLGKRCYILFTGTSINNLNFDLLKNEPVIACGASVLNKDLTKCNLIGYFNPGPWEPRSLLFMDFIFNSIFRKTKRGCNIFLDTTGFPYVKKLAYYREKDTYYISSNGNYLSKNDINSDLTNLNNVQEGSLSTALAIASYMGFKEIYLLGADYLSDPPIFGHFYDGFDEVGKASDYESYRERAFWMIDHVQNRGCKVINVIKDNNQTSIIKSITFQDLE